MKRYYELCVHHVQQVYVKWKCLQCQGATLREPKSLSTSLNIFPKLKPLSYKLQKLKTVEEDEFVNGLSRFDVSLNVEAPN